MKGFQYFSRVGFLIRINILLLFVLTGTFTTGAELSLFDAIHKGLVKVVIQGNPTDTSKRFVSRYYGLCLLINLQSTAKTTLNLRIESGRFLDTADTNEQRMMVTRDELIVLLPARKKSLRLYAMCTQMHDHSPGDESLLALGAMADGNLLTLAQFLGKNNFQSQAAQQAVWVITDNNDPGSIYSDNANEMNQLQQLVCKLTGKFPPPAPHSIFYSSGMVSGEIVFKNTQPESYSFVMMDEAGKIIGTFFKEKTIGMTIVTTLNWRFRFNKFPNGVYYVKLLNSKNEAVVSRPVLIE